MIIFQPIVTLEPIQVKHLPEVQRYAAHPGVAATSNIPHPYPEDAALQWYRRITPHLEEGKAHVFAILMNGAFCGVISLNDIRWPEGVAELDYWVAVEFQGQGAATEAADQVIALAGSEFGLTTLRSGCLTSNRPSARVLEKNGFKPGALLPIDRGKFRGETLRRYELKLR